MHRRCGSMWSPICFTSTSAMHRRRRRCSAGASPIHRRCIADASPMHRRCGAILRPHLLRPHLRGL
eukprot:1627496-Pyramimonas_sp.AAC.1